LGLFLKTPGILAKIVGVIGMVIAIRGIMLLTSKTSEKVFEWWGERPLVFFRVWGVVVFATGVMLMFVK
jgi:hypothetical protein